MTKAAKPWKEPSVYIYFNSSESWYSLNYRDALGWLSMPESNIRLWGKAIGKPAYQIRKIEESDPTRYTSDSIHCVINYDYDVNPVDIITEHYKDYYVRRFSANDISTRITS